jgi:hypothetical protein
MFAPRLGQRLKQRAPGGGRIEWPARRLTLTLALIRHWALPKDSESVLP